MNQAYQEDIERITRTWNIALSSTNSFDLGSEIFLKFLSKNPKYKSQFKRLRLATPENIRRKGSFVDHVTRIMNRLRVTVACLTSEGGFEEIETIWREIGESHQTYKVTVKAFKDMNEAIIEVLSEMGLNGDDRQAWMQLLAEITDIVERGLNGSSSNK